MAYASTADYWGRGGDSDTATNDGAVRIPALGQYDANRRNLLIAECVLVSGDSDGVPTATSDTDADIMVDSADQEIMLFNIEADSDYDEQGIIVTQVPPIVVTAFTASVTATIGDTDDADGWIKDAGFDVSSSNDSSIFIVSTADGAEPESVALLGAGGGKHYATSSGAIDIVFGGTTDVAAGRLAVYAVYFMCNRAGGGNS